MGTVWQAAAAGGGSWRQPGRWAIVSAFDLCFVLDRAAVSRVLAVACPLGARTWLAESLEGDEARLLLQQHRRQQAG